MQQRLRNALAAVGPALGLAFAALTFGCGSAPSMDGIVPGNEQTKGAGVGSIVCAADGARTTTPRVEARLDGVHLQLDNRLADGGFEFSYAEGGGGGNAPAGESRQVVDIPPGELRIGCYGGTSGEIASGGLATLEIVDGDGSYVPTELECPGGGVAGGGPAYGGDLPEGEKGDLTAVARRSLSESLQPDDEVEVAGYPKARERRSVRVVRDGAVVAVLDFLPSGNGWLPDSYTACEDF